ncbi:retinol dehydrogenase 12-like isoform X2 [Ruditapes philippinarum]|uniref:retinol dehydrogenase 12-like isoform X2 n=1 Tax=Ruditapes philippinarum TaxID=129788 RepID=UPI00295B7518|nr:retinol dehydrogenase 12-like isoform X2 [Ruditapes philippinarum]
MPFKNLSDVSTSAKEFVQDHKIAIACTVTTACGLIALKRYMAGGVCRSKALMNGKTVLITGANTGIGKETAKDLASRGARVLLACRDITKAERAAEDIRKSTGNKDVVVYILDLCSLKSVRQCADDVIKKEARLDVLINNAGVMWTPYWKTKDGFEMQFGTNHLGHFLFTNLLLDLLKKSAPSRIINVSSLAHERGTINFDDLNSEKSYSPAKAYSQSKLANVLFTRELSKRLQGTGVTANSLHPGVIKTELGRYRDTTLWRRILFVPVILFVFKTPIQGAQTTIHCAVSKDLTDVSGKYFSDCVVKLEAPQAHDDEAAAKLWTVSEEMVGLTQKS